MSSIVQRAESQNRRRFGRAEAKRLGSRLGLDWRRIKVARFRDQLNSMSPRQGENPLSLAARAAQSLGADSSSNPQWKLDLARIRRDYAAKTATAAPQKSSRRQD